MATHFLKSMKAGLVHVGGVLRNLLILSALAGSSQASMLGFMERLSSDQVRSAAAEGVARQQSLALYSTEQRALDFAACSDKFPAGRVTPSSLFNVRGKLYGLCSDQFAVIYSGTSKGPLLVVERLNAGLLEQAHFQRSNTFFTDPRLPSSASADLDDYRGSNYDRGHNACAADSASENAMAQSFALSNIVPQDRYNNEQVWSRVEAATRHYIKRAEGDVFVFTGPLFQGSVNTIGRHGVWVPSHMYKLVYDPTARRAWGWVMSNDAESRMGPPMSYEEFVRHTHLPLLAGIPVGI